MVHSLRIALLTVFLTLGGAAPAVAAWTSPRPAHPLAWMHQLPAGETPGWETPSWTHAEFSWANVWNAPLAISNRTNGRSLTYTADFEQKSTILEKGVQITPWFAIAAEFALADRSGGVFDRFIDDFHETIDSHRFRRQFHPANQSRFQLTSDGANAFSHESSSGLSNAKLKLKFWPVQWKSQCACGIGFSFQAKFPTSDVRRGLSSGSMDYSGLAHVGIPVRSESAFYLTAGVTTLGKNEALKDWPRKENILMLDATMDLSLVAGLGFVAQAYTGSPFIDQTPLEIVDPDPSDPEYKEKRTSTGWNALVLWRVYESFGLRYKWKSGAQITFLFTEDIGINDYDEVDDYIYVNGSPDAMVTGQLTIPF